MNSARASSAPGHRPRRRTPLLRRAARFLLLALLLLFVVLLWSSETWQGERWEFSNDKKDDGGAGAGAGTQRVPLDGKESAPPMLNNKAGDEAGNTHTDGPPTDTTTSSPPPLNTTTTIAVPEVTLVSAPPPLRLEQTPPSLDVFVNETTRTTRTCSSNSSRSSSSGHHWRNSSSKESSVLVVSVSDASHTNTTTTTNLTTAINSTAVPREGDEPPSGTPQPSLPSFPSPPPTLPVRPALWADGGGSVRLHGVFSVLTLAAGPPVTLATSSTPSAPPHPSPPPPPTAAAAARAEWLLRRAARGLHASGLTRHSRFHEWLIMHGGGPAVDGGVKAWQLGEEEAAVRAWWTEQEQREQRQSFSAAAQHTPAAALPRVRVAGLPPLPRSTAHLDKKAFALLFGVRLVVTEYVLLHDLSMVLIPSAPPSSPFPAHSSERRELNRDEWVRREVDVALQTISRNALADSPVVVVDAAPAVAAQEEEEEGGGRSMREEEVHCFRLQVYASADRRNATRETELQAQLVSFVKRALDPQPSPVNTRQQTTVNAHASAVPAAMTDEGLPAEVYSTSPHFHCQRAPLYGVRMPVPAWMRAAAPRASLSPPNTAVAVSAPPRGENNKNANTTTHEKKARPLALLLSTLCEVLLSRRSGMPDDFAPPTGAFFSPFCQEWWQLISLPLPSAGPKTLTAEEANTHVNTSNPLAAFGFGAAARQRHTKPQDGGGEAAEKGNGDEDEDDVKAQKQDMLQGMGDGLCTVEWLATLKAAQLFHAEEAERQRSEYARRKHPQQRHQQQQQQVSSSGRTTPESRAARGNATLSNIAGLSPYLRQYARLLFEQDVSGDADDGGAARRSRLAGTYLAYFPNATHALQRIHTVVSEKLRHVSLKYAAERTRRHKSRKAVTDREVVCVPSTLARVDRHAGLYATQWFLTNVALRCVLHKENCFGGLFESDVRVWQNVDRYLSTTGKWGRGEFRVCMSAGIFVADPSSVLT